jgi:hypothetical protein
MHVVTYVVASLDFINVFLRKVACDLERALNVLIESECTLMDGGEAIVTMRNRDRNDWGRNCWGRHDWSRSSWERGDRHRSRAKRHLTKAGNQISRWGWISNGTKGGMCLRNMSVLGQANLRDGVSDEGAYTTMSSVNANVLSAKVRYGSLAREDRHVAGLGNFNLTWSEARGGRRQRRASSSGRRNYGEWVMLTSKTGQ